MNKQRLFMVLSVIFIALLISGCTSSEKKTLLVSKELSPSSSEQVISPQNSTIAVRIPAGLITAKQSLEISSIKNPQPSFFAGVKSLQAYEITLGNTQSNESFNNEATLEFTYNASDIPAGISPEDAFMVAYYDTDSKSWIEVPTTIDKVNHKIIIKTTHFSIWDLFGLLTDYEQVPSPQGHFTVYYDKKSNFKCLGSETRSEHLCAEGIGKIAEIARTAYINEGYKVPDKVNIYIADIEESEMSPYTGNILISKTLEIVGAKSKTEDLDLANSRLKHEIAHELFHVVQNQYINIYSMKSRQWFIEASADYAADKIAMKDGTMGMDIKPDYLSSALYSSARLHDYSTAHFINYLVEKNDVTFQGMFNYVNTNNALDARDTLMLLKDYTDNKGVQAETSYNNLQDTKFSDAYHGFAGFFLFDPKSPIKIKGDFESEIGSIVVDLKSTDDSKLVDVPAILPYATQIIAIHADPGTDAVRTININPQEDLGSSTTGRVSLDVYLAVNGDPHNAKFVGSTRTKAQKINADLGKDDTLYVLAIDTNNPAGGSSRDFNIEITASKNGKKKSVSFKIDKTGDLTQNKLTIKGTGAVTGPADMVAVVDSSNPNIMHLTIANPKGIDIPIEITGKLKYDVAETHWKPVMQSDCTVTKDVSNFKYKISYNAPEKKEIFSTDGSFDILVSQEMLAKGEFRAAVDLVWDWTDDYLCTEDSKSLSGKQHATGGPGTNVLDISIQSSAWGW